MPKTTEKESFEKSLQKLEDIVAQLEKGDLSLEQQLKSFESGVSLSSDCMKRLEEIEQRVETLVTKADGSLETEAFASSGE